MLSISFQRILLSFAVLLAVGGAVAASTGAFFNDTETSTGNTFAAGELDLKIDNSSYGFDWNNPLAQNPTGVWGPNQANSWQLSDLTNQLFFSFDDLKPGDYGEDTISLHVQNNAWACMAMDLTTTPDNGINDPEAGAGDVTDGATGGELQNFLSFMFWYDDGDNVLETGEQVIQALSGLPGSIFTGAWLPIAEGGDTPDTPLQAGATKYIGKGWCFGTMTSAPVAQDGVNTNPPSAPARVGFTCSGAGNHNIAQTDGIEVAVSFYSEQSRNNPNFLCSSLPTFVGTAGREVGASLASYDDPATCNAVVDDSFGGPVAPNFSTIQAAINDATTESGETICVNSGTYAEVVNVNKSVTIAGVGAAGSAVVNGGFIIDADAVTVKGLKVTGGNAEGTFAGFYIKSGVDNLDIVFNDIDGPGANDITTSGGSRGVINVSGVPISDILVENNTIREWTSGVYTNPDVAGGTVWMIRFNDIDDNLAGIGELNSAHVVANEFTNVAAAAEAIGVGPTYDGGSVENNNFLVGTKLNTYGPIAIDVDADNNFWGPSGGATQTGGTDETDFTPETLVQYPHN